MSYTIKNLSELPKDFIIDENLKGSEYSIGNNIEIPLILENIFKYKKSYLFFYNNDIFLRWKFCCQSYIKLMRYWH